jgi:mannose-6-phosphate isomerase-like protein (cupin superfamily)
MPSFLNVAQYSRGWLIGDFVPSIFRMKSFEIALAEHLEGEPTVPHFHTSSEEVNVVIRGELKVNGRLLSEGDIFIYSRGEISDVTFIRDSKLLVIRVPSAPNDKVVV